MHCSLGCPEAARLALTDTAAMELVSIDAQPVARAVPVAAHRVRRAPGLASEDEVNDESLDCVQASAGVFAQTARHLLSRSELNATHAWTLFNVAVHCAKAKALAAKSKSEAVRAIEQELAAMRHRDDLPALVQTMQQQDQSTDSVNRLLELGYGIASLLASAQGSSFARGVLPRAFSVFGFEPGNNVRTASAARLYAQAESQCFEPFDRAHPHLLKNVVLNDIGLNNFPTADLEGLTKQTLGVLMRLSMIRLFIVGRAALTRERFDVGDYIEVVTAFSRWVEKDRRFKDTPVLH
jgi:hypothetical protein